MKFFDTYSVFVVISCLVSVISFPEIAFGKVTEDPTDVSKIAIEVGDCEECVEEESLESTSPTIPDDIIQSIPAFTDSSSESLLSLPELFSGDESEE